MGEKYDPRLIEAILPRDIKKARKTCRNGYLIRVLKRDNLLDDVYEAKFEITNDKYPNIVEITDMNLLRRAKAAGVGGGEIKNTQTPEYDYNH